MRRIAILVALLVASNVARADTVDDRTLPLLGLRLDFGALPWFGQRAEMFGIEIGVEHHAFCGFRVFGEYEWLFISSTDSSSSSSSPMLDGTGQRAHVGLRHALLAKTWRRGLRLFMDGEVGGGLALTADNLTGSHAIPHAFAGVRLGYDLLFVRQHVLEAEFVVRGIKIDHGGGVMFGVGFSWGG